MQNSPFGGEMETESSWYFRPNQGGRKKLSHVKNLIRNHYFNFDF